MPLPLHGSRKAELEKLLAARGFAATLPRADQFAPPPEAPPQAAAFPAPWPAPPGCLLELVPESGGEGAGVTSLALRFLAAATRPAATAGSPDRPPAAAAWVDATDAFDPLSAARAGARLQRLLWARAASAPPAALLEAAHRLIHSGGFGLVALDLLDRPATDLRLPRAAWFRLRAALRLARRCSLLVLAPRPLCGACADAVWSVGRAASLWDERAAPLFLGGRLRLRAARLRRGAAPDAAAPKKPPAPVLTPATDTAPAAIAEPRLWELRA